MLKVDTVCMETQADKIRQLAGRLDAIASRVGNVSNNLRWNVSVGARVRNSLNSEKQALSRMDDTARYLAETLRDAAQSYQTAEQNATSEARTGTVVWGKAVLPPLQPVPLIHSNEHLPKDIERKNLSDDMGDSILDEMDSAFRDFVFDGLGTIDDYLKIGRTIGVKNALGYWARNAAGLNLPGSFSTNRDLFSRFKGNLFNSSSPFKKQLTDAFKDYTGANGAGKATAAWGATILDGVLNFFDNKEEQKASDGEMTDGRVVAETVTETAVNVVLNEGAKWAVGAAVAAVAGTVASPLVVAAAATAIVVGANVLVDSLTGKSMTEHISDFVVDTGEAVVDGAKKLAKSVGDKAKKTAKSIGKWFDKIF